MPELPDILTYVDALRERIPGETLEAVRLKSPFLLRSFDPPLAATHGRTVVRIDRLGKRILIGLEGDLWLVIHLMIAGRFHWKEREARIGSRINLAAFDFSRGTLLLTEAGTKKRASLHVVGSYAGLEPFRRTGIDPRTATPAAFRERLRAENHTVKRSLTDPRLFDGIGNAYSDEILHAARLSPLKLTSRLTDDEFERLHDATCRTLDLWIERFREQRQGGFPEKVTAFRPEMAVHGRFALPCPVCGAKVQRIRYADNETNYCARCQTGGRLLADRGLSRLLKDDWPRSLDELDG